MKLHISLRFKNCVLMAVLFAAAGCNSPEPKIPHVVTRTATHAIAYEGHKAQLTRAGLDDLDAFLASVPLSAVSHVALETDNSNPRGFERAKRIKAYLVKQGIDARKIQLQPVPDGNSGVMAITIAYAKVIPPHPCPDWSKNSIANYDNTRFSNFGCSYYTNLTAQLVDPADYVRGQGHPEISGARDSVSVQRYQADVLPPVSTQSASTPNSGATVSSGTSVGTSSGGP